MKAAVIERFGRIEVRELPEPVVGEYDALCELLFGAVCSGTDQHILQGRFPFPVLLPTILGHESIGRVVRTGAKARYLKEGDLVTRVGAPATEEVSINWGGFAEFGVAKDYRAAEEDGVAAAEWRGGRVNQVLPADTDPAAATMFITWRETLSYATRMGFAGGANVLIVGSGGNGLSFASHARNAGAARCVLVGSASRKAEALRAGASDLVDYKAADADDVLGGICPEGFDFVVDAVGKDGLADRVLPFLKPGGAFGVYGVDEFKAYSLHPSKARGGFTVKGMDYDEAESHEAVLEHFQKGELDASVWLDLENPYPLDRIGDALEAARTRTAVKPLIRIRG